MKTTLSLAVLAVGLTLGASAHALTQAQLDVVNSLGDSCSNRTWNDSFTRARCGDATNLRVTVPADGVITRWVQDALFLPGAMNASIQNAFPGAEVRVIRRNERLNRESVRDSDFDLPSPAFYVVKISHEGIRYKLSMNAYGEIGRVRETGTGGGPSLMPPLDFAETPESVDFAFAQVGEYCPNPQWVPCDNEVTFTAHCDTPDRLRIRFHMDGTIRNVRADILALPLLSAETIADTFEEYEVRRQIRIESRWGTEPLRYRAALYGQGAYRAAVVSPMGDLLRAARLVEMSDVPSAVLATLTPNEAGSFHRSWAIELPDETRYRFVYHMGTTEAPMRRAVVIAEDGTLIRVRDWAPPGC